MINVIQDIIDIVQNDSRHHVKIVMDGIYFTVYLDDDEECAFEEKYIIPIRYDCLDDNCYIPHNEYCEMMHDNDFGIDMEEISLIHKIMQCMKNNKNEINQICNCLSLNNRKSSQEEDDDLDHGDYSLKPEWIITD